MTFVPNEAGIQGLLNSVNGPVARELGRLAVQVETQAKVNATGFPVAGANNPEGRGPRVRTGRLRSSITWTLAVDGQGLYAQVGTNVGYGFYLETGLLRGGKSFPFLRPALLTVIA